MSLDTELSDLEALVYSATFHVTSPVTADDIYEAILNYFKDIVVGAKPEQKKYLSEEYWNWAIDEYEANLLKALEGKK